MLAFPRVRDIELASKHATPKPWIRIINSYSPRDKMRYVNGFLLLTALTALILYAKGPDLLGSETARIEQDSNAQCGQLKTEGECDTNPSYMLDTCCQSCGSCLQYFHHVPPAIRLPTSKRNMPRVGFGTAGLGMKTQQAVLDAIDIGYRRIDTAEAKEWYKEDEVGKALSQRYEMVPRHQFFLSSKIMPRDYGEMSTRDAIQRILRELNTTYLDLIMLHYPQCWGKLCGDRQPEGTWKEGYRVLETLVEEGVVLALGVSNFQVSELQQLVDFAKIRPSLVQYNSEPFKPANNIQRFCRRHHIHFEPYSSLGGQYATEPASPVLNHPAIVAIAAKHSKTPAQVVLRWALQHGQSVVPRSSNVVHMKENLNVFSFDLSDEDIRMIDSISSQ